MEILIITIVVIDVELNLFIPILFKLLHFGAKVPQPIKPYLFIAALDSPEPPYCLSQLVPQLEAFGYHCFKYSAVADLLEGVALHAPECGVVIVAGRPQLVGHALAFLRALHPGLLLLAAADFTITSQLISAFEGGADILLPVDATVPVWVAACSAALRRAGGAAHVVAGGSARADQNWVYSPVVSQLITPQGIKVDLSLQENLLIQQLLKVPGQSVPRAQLIKTVLSKQQAAAERASNHLGVLISRLRRKFQRNGVSLPISTVHSQGYRFTAGVNLRADA